MKIHPKIKETPVSPRKEEKVRWIGAKESVTIHDYHIKSCLFYLGDISSLKVVTTNGNYNRSTVMNNVLASIALDPQLPVPCSRSRNIISPSPFLMRYEQLPPYSRANYLQWLAGGRKDENVNPAHLFLYFHGLEYRLVVEGGMFQNLDAKDRAEIITELIRLIEIYGDNSYFYKQLNNLLLWEKLFWSPEMKEPLPDYFKFDHPTYYKTFQFKLAEYAQSHSNLPPEMAFDWYRLHPVASRKLLATQYCPEEFRELFQIYYKQKYTQGLPLKVGSEYFTFIYKVANYELKILSIPSIKSKLSDPFFLMSSVHKLNLLGEKVTEKLEALARYRKRVTEDTFNPIKDYALLPKELLDKSEINKIRTKLLGLCSKGYKLVTWNELLKHFYNPDYLSNSRSNIAKKEKESLLLLLEKWGLSLFPDVRYINVPLIPDTQLMLYTSDESLRKFTASSYFCERVTMLRMCALLAQAHAPLQPSTQKLLGKWIKEDKQITDSSQCVLHIAIEWCFKTPQVKTGLKLVLQKVLSEAQRKLLHKMLLYIAYNNGRMVPQSITELTNLYRLLNLSKDDVINDLHALATNIADPPTIRQRDTELNDYSISKDNAKKGLPIDRELLQRRQKETNQVQALLSQIFTDTEDIHTPPPVSSVQNSGSKEGSVLPETSGLDSTHYALLCQLLEKEDWEHSRVVHLCKQLELMPDGALEVINEWSFAKINAPLIEGGETLFVDCKLAGELLGVKEGV